jgi:hypothetical protein
MSIFGGLSTPEWIQGVDIFKPDPVAAENASRLGAGLGEYQQRQRQAAVQLQTNAKLNHIVDQMDGVKNPADIMQSVAEHPAWMLDPQTAPLVSNILKTAQESSKIQNTGIAAKVATSQLTDFTKQLDALNSTDPAGVAGIRGMKPNPDGTPTKQMWDALSFSQQAADQAKKNAATQAQIDAISRGDQETTTISPKGVSTTFKPSPPNKAEAANTEPQLKTFPDGTTVIYNPKGGGFHLLDEQNKTKPMSTSEMSQLYRSTGIDDDWKKALGDELKKRSGTSGEPMALPKSKTDLKKGQKYNTSRGVATWDGAQFSQ